MNKKPVPLKFENHKNTSVIPRKGFEDYANENLLPLTANEFSSAASSFPIVFIKNGKTGQFQSIAMSAFEAGNNLYCNSTDAQWEGVYVPQVIQREPFTLGADPNDDKTLIVYLDENSGLLHKSEGDNLFEKNGDESTFLKGVHKQLGDYYQAELASHAFTKALLENNLLKEIELSINFDSQRSKRIKGLYTVDEEKLSSLDEPSIVTFFQKGYLVPIYAMLNSITQFNRLLSMHNKRMDEKVVNLKMHVADGDEL